MSAAAADATRPNSPVARARASTHTRRVIRPPPTHHTLGSLGETVEKWFWIDAAQTAAESRVTGARRKPARGLVDKLLRIWYLAEREMYAAMAVIENRTQH